MPGASVVLEPFIQIHGDGHATEILVMFDDPTVPDPLVTAQVCAEGCDLIDTAYDTLLLSLIANVKDEALAAGATVSLPLASTRPGAVNPAIVPPTVYVGADVPPPPPHPATAESDEITKNRRRAFISAPWYRVAAHPGLVN
jgi:hypothetical protein